MEKVRGFEKIVPDSDVKLPVRKTAGERIMQGIFTPYFIADNDNASGERTGGFGSTGTR